VTTRKEHIVSERSQDPLEWGDDLGPEKVVYVYQPDLGLRAVAVVDNVACGPAIGGVRMAEDVSAEEAFRLARAMTLKNAAAGLPHGGGKSVLVGDPGLPEHEKERLLRAFAVAIRDFTDYIPGPDMGTNEVCMAWIHDEIGRSAGLPAEVGGIPLDEIGATGFGLAVCAEVASELCRFDLAGARVAVQGFGSVGQHAARFLAQRGAILVAAADSRSTLVNPAGIDVDALIASKQQGAGVREFPKGEKLDREAVIDVDCDIWIPAARPDVVRADNVERLRTRLVLQGANIPCTPAAEQTLHERGVLVVPDFIANAGGVICAAVEYAGGSRDQAMATIENKIRANSQAVLEAAERELCLPRTAAERLARERVERAARLRRFHGHDTARPNREMKRHS
jgi:glutamate dehydrogenase/leucine dehydrogenase